MKTKKYKPININEMVGGQHYIHIGVALDGMMWMTTFTFCGQPFAAHHGLKIRGQVLSGPGFLSFSDGTRFASDSGLLSCKYNSHRMFKFTEQNRARLTDLIARNALTEYLVMIGDKNAAATIRRNLTFRRDILASDDRY